MMYTFQGGEIFHGLWLGLQLQNVLSIPFCSAVGENDNGNISFQL